MIELEVNGKRLRVDADDDTPLLWVLRDHLGLTGTKFGCGVGLCGSCTVHVDGVARRSCGVPLSSLADAKVTTIEGLSPDQRRAVAAAWIAEQVPQCGYCQPGMIMAAVSFLEEHPDPSEADIERGITNLCRCGTYPRIRRAILEAARLVRSGGEAEEAQS